jgi:hypothetical protein
MSVEASIAPPRRLFYGLAITLLLFAVASAFVQTGYESGVGTSGAKRMAAGLKETAESKSEVERLISNAGCWQSVGFAAVLLAFLSWGIAMWRRERHRWVWLVVLLSIYVMLELLMV